ncbi:MAG: gamma-glutamyltransferase [Methylococcales bacterium]
MIQSKLSIDNLSLIKILVICIVVLLSGCASDQKRSSSASKTAPINQPQLVPPAAAIASAHPLATQAGINILAQGGNAFDAAITVAAVLAVVEPSGSGLGGGGFWLLHRASDNKQVMLDSRETAPMAAHRDLYLDKNGKVLSNKSLDGALAAGIPGVPAAIVYLAEHYGQLPLSSTLAPAINYARDGFTVEEPLLRLMKMRKNAIQASTGAARVFLDNGLIPKPGARLVQTDLADTLTALAKQGHAGFYTGEIAEKLVAGVQSGGGIWSLEDLSRYQVIEREPIVGEYQGVRIISAALPSSGGLVLMETLNILAGYPLQELDSAARKHLIVEAWKRAYRDRAEYMGDPDFVTIPTERLLSLDYANALKTTIQDNLALPSKYLAAPQSEIPQGNNTTHFSVLDKQGNRVATTLSINYPFGSGFIAEGTGVLLNDEMDDFAASPESPNVYGLVGGEANAIASGKRMLSSMTPTFFESNDRIAIVGTPGGSRIITMVCLALLDFVKGNSPASWVSLPRFHHQFIPDLIQYEVDALSKAEIQALQQRGHVLKASSRRYGNMHAIVWNQTSNTVKAASDPRGIGLAVVK